jgi:hypothetical protein
MAKAKQRCTALTLKGIQCKRWATEGTNPPVCHFPSHGGSGKKTGAPLGNKNAETHGFYSAESAAQTLEANIADLQAKRDKVSQHLDDHGDDLPLLERAKIVDLLGRLDSRITRHYKHLWEITGKSGDTVERDIDRVLDYVWDVLKREDPPL